MSYGSSETLSSGITMDEINDELVKALTAQTGAFIRYSDRVAATAKLLEVISTNRLYLMGPDDMEALWGTIRSEPALVDLLLQTAHDFVMRVSLLGMQADELVRYITYASAWIQGSDAKYSVIDEDLLERLYDEEDTKYYTNNLWFVTLLLIQRSGAIQQILPPPEEGE